MTSILIPIRTKNGLNNREHWRVRWRRVKAERTAAYTMSPKFPLPCRVLMTRLSPGTLDDDNLLGSLKGIRDGIADRLGVDDRDPRIVWDYAQERAKQYGVRVDFLPLLSLQNRNE